MNMSHAVYQTKALILKTKNMRESNKLVYLYTEKFGLIYASMQSLRILKSKMRYHVHPYSLVDVDLVSGKSIWRITGIHERQSSFSFVGSPWYRIISLFSDTLMRLCIGEERNEQTWEIVNLLFELIKKGDSEYYNEAELAMMVHILHSLGYWVDTDEVFKFQILSQDSFLYLRKYRMEYVQKINHALHESQL